jgi:hypothetical protein
MHAGGGSTECPGAAEGARRRLTEGSRSGSAGVPCGDGACVLPMLQPSLPLWFGILVAALIAAKPLVVYPLADREHRVA